MSLKSGVVSLCLLAALSAFPCVAYADVTAEPATDGDQVGAVSVPADEPAVELAGDSAGVEAAGSADDEAALAVVGAPAAGELPAVDESPAAGEAPDVGETPAVEEEEEPAAAEAPAGETQAEETPAATEAPGAEVAPTAAEEPAAEEAQAVAEKPAAESKPAAEPKPAAPAEPANTTKPAPAAKPTTPSAPAALAKQASTAKPAAPAKPATAAKPAALAKPATAAKSTAKAASSAKPSISYRTHVQKQGWQKAVSDGRMAGTSGKSLRIEALRISLSGIRGDVQYQAYIQKIGWQDVKTRGAAAGTSGQSLRLEALRIALTGDVSKRYDVRYRAHVQGIGWQGWVTNGALAGTVGKDRRLEAIQIELVEKKAQAKAPNAGIVGVRYRAHVQKVGWQGYQSNGAVAGTSGRSLRVEALNIALDRGTYSGNIEYRAHVQGIGWQGWKKNGALTGTSGQSRRVEALQIRLTGNIARDYDVVYRAHVQNVGWQDWVAGGAIAGTSGRSLRVEAVQIRLMRKPSVPTPARTVADGLYTLSPASSSGLVATPASTSNAGGVNVQLGSRANWRLEQKWVVTWKGNGYELMDANSGKVLDAARGNTNLVANVQQANRNNLKSQRWAIMKNADGSFSLAGMYFGTRLDVADSRMKSGTNLHLWSPNGSAAQKFTFRKADPLVVGTYELFTKLDQSGKSLDVPGSTTKNAAQLDIRTSDNGVDKHFVVRKSGGFYTVQSAVSGKYLTVSGNRVVQAARNGAAAQKWTASVSPYGGLVLKSASGGKAMTVAGNRNASGAMVQVEADRNAAGQRWYPQARPLVATGLYALATSATQSVKLDVDGGSFANGANALLQSAHGRNSQKFVISEASGGYVRIGMAMANTALAVQGASKANGANVRMETRSGSAAQLWKPVVTDSGLSFVNKASGKALSFAAARAGSNVRQSNAANTQTQAWVPIKAVLNSDDLSTYYNAIAVAPGGGSVRLGNAAPGYSVSRSAWNRLMSALNACWSEGFDPGFVMMDCNTAMTVSYNADKTYYAASTVKGLYVTYLFEEYLEKGYLTWGDISDLAWPAIVNSDNAAYQTLRARYGSESGFERWLNAVGADYIDVRDYYTPRNLAAAWTHMCTYLDSDGYYVDTWKSIFGQTILSPIRQAMGGYRTIYSKPGWVQENVADSFAWRTLNDAGTIIDRSGNKYVVAVMSGAEPTRHYGVLGNLIDALDDVHLDMPSHR